MDQDETWHAGRPRLRRLCVSLRPSSTFPKKGAEPTPQFSAHVYCDQTARWIKMALGVEVGYIVLYGDPAPLPKKGTEPPQFSAIGPFLLCINGCMYQDTTWYGGRFLSR